MTSLLCDISIWSLREDDRGLLVRDTDFSCFKYYDKNQHKTQAERPYAQDKMTYATNRGLVWVLDNVKKRGSGGGSYTSNLTTGLGSGPSSLQLPSGPPMSLTPQDHVQKNENKTKRLRNNLRELEELLMTTNATNTDGNLSVVWSAWRSSILLQLMFSNGLIANLMLDKLGNLEKITFDKFLVGRLLEFVTDVAFSERLLVVTYLESRITIVTFGKILEFPGTPSYTLTSGSSHGNNFENIAQCDPKIHVLDLLGPPARRLERKILLSDDSSIVLFWWSISGHEVFPWTPQLRDEDRANVMMFSLKNPSQPSRLGFIRTHTDPIGFRFLSDLTVHYIGQEITTRSGRGPSTVANEAVGAMSLPNTGISSTIEVQVENCVLYSYSGDSQLRRRNPHRLTTAITSNNLSSSRTGTNQMHSTLPPSRITCHAFISDHLVVLGTTEGTLLLMDINQHKLECQTKCGISSSNGATFIPSFLRVHPDGAIFIAASANKAVIQGFDVALNPIRLSLVQDADIQSSQSANSSVGIVLDFTQYFDRTANLTTDIPGNGQSNGSLQICDAFWCERKNHKKKPNSTVQNRKTNEGKNTNFSAAVQKYLDTTPCSMETMARNYLCIRFQHGPLALVRVNGGSFGSPSPGALGPVEIVSSYLGHNLYNKVLLLLNQLNWTLHGPTILSCINTTFNKLMRTFAIEPSREVENYLEMCLGLFYAPSRSIPDDIVDEYSEQIHDLSRRFFHALVRQGQLIKAFRLAVDINDYDLFVDLHHAAKRYNMTDMSEAAIIKAQRVYAEEMPDSLSPSSGSSSASRSEEGSKSPSEGSNYSDEGEMPLKDLVSKHKEETQEGKRDKMDHEQNLFQPTFTSSNQNKQEQVVFPGQLPPTVTNFSLLGPHSAGIYGSEKSQQYQPISLGRGSSQNLESRHTSNTLFPKPIDVVALLSGADQFSNRQQISRQQHSGLPGPLQLFSNLSISEDGRKNPGPSDTYPTDKYHEGVGMDNTPRLDSINSGITDGTHLSLQPQMDVTFASQTTRTARKINTSEYQSRTDLASEMLQRKLSSGEDLPLPPPPPLPPLFTESNIAKSHESIDRLDLTATQPIEEQSASMFDSVIGNRYSLEANERETSRYMGLPKTVISAAKASTRSMNDDRSGNQENVEECVEEDPEDIKVIHFGIV